MEWFLYTVCKKGARWRLIIGIVPLGIVIDVGVQYAFFNEPSQFFLPFFVRMGSLFGGIGVWLIIRGSKMMRNPWLHHVLWNLGKEGSRALQIATAIEHELMNSINIGNV